MERKRKWWKRFGDEVREMVGSNDMISNVLLNQIPEKTATVEISDDKMLHHHTTGSLREEIQVRNDIDIETNVETNLDIETAAHIDMTDVHLKEIITDIAEIKHTMLRSLHPRMATGEEEIRESREGSRRRSLSV